MAATVTTSNSLGNSLFYINEFLCGAGLAPNLHCALSLILLSHP